LGILIFIIILRKLNVKLVLSLLANAEPVILLIALFLKLPFLVIKCCRWQYLLRIQGIDYDLKSSLLAYLGSMYMGLVTPGRIGDFAKVFHLKKDKNVSFSKGSSSVFVDRMFDLLILISMACVGGLALALSWNILIVIFAFLLLFLAIIFAFMNELIGKKVMSILFSMFLPRRIKELAKVRFSSFYSGIEQLKNAKIVYPLSLSLLSYLLFFTQSYLIAKSLNIPISFLNVAFSISTANLVSLIPISIAGIGTRDATLISIFSVLNLSKESAMAFSIMFLFISNISSCLIGAIAWFKKPVDVRA
jgi:uncharacterized protein (TIRG00374 family)